MDTMIRRDTAERLDALDATIKAMFSLAHESDRRLVPVALMQRVFGQCLFVSDTCKHMRAFTNWTARCLRVKTSLNQHQRTDKRKRATFMAMAAGAHPDNGGGIWN